MTIMSCEFESHFLHEEKIFAEIAQLVEHNLAKVRVASSSLVFRSSLYILLKMNRRCFVMNNAPSFFISCYGRLWGSV